MCSSDLVYFCFFFNATATTEIYTLSLHDALPILIYVYSHPGWCDFRPFMFFLLPTLNFEMFSKSEFHFTLDLFENVDHMKFGDILSAGIKHDLRRHSQLWLGYTRGFETWSISGKCEIAIFKRFLVDLHSGFFPYTKGFDLRVGFGISDF